MRTLVLASILLLSTAAPAVHANPLRPATETAIDTAMATAIDSGWVAGGVVGVMRDGDVVFTRGYGQADLESQTSVTADTVFRIGSLTKQVTAAMMLLLAEDGVLSLDDPVRRHLASFPQDDPTTLRQLLNHTAGIADVFGREGFDQREMWLPLTSEQRLAYVLAADPLHTAPPGQAWAYSNSHYLLAGAVIEQVTGRPLAEVFKTRVFDRLGMADTALDDARAVIPHRAEGYDRAVVETPGYIKARAISLSLPFAAGGLRSSASDLLTWADALATGALLSPASLEAMATAAVIPGVEGAPQTIAYGLGVGLSEPGRPLVLSHDGAIDGFAATLTQEIGSRDAVVILVNTSPSAHLPFAAVTAAIAADRTPSDPGAF